MRLWHQELIKILPDKQLASQHRECCALRGKGWGKKHATVDYVFTHGLEELTAYHFLVMEEMRNRGVFPDMIWSNPAYRGKSLGYDKKVNPYSTLRILVSGKIYPEHEEEYMMECLDNIIEKLKIKLYDYIKKYGTLDPRTIALSQELDKFIVKKQDEMRK